MLLVDEVHRYSQDRQLAQQRLRYRFAGGRYDLLGRGFLGFSEVSVDDLTTKERKVAYYDNQTRVGTFYPFAGVAWKTTTITPILEEKAGDQDPSLTTPTGTTTARIQEATHTHDVRWLHDDRAYFTHPLQSVETEWEQQVDISGETVVPLGAQPPPAREVSHTFVVDNFGNVTYSSRATTGGTYSWTMRILEDREEDWIFGLETKRFTVGAEAGTFPAPRVTEMTYDRDGFLESIVREPGEPTLKQTTWFYRDERGLVTHVMQTASGLPHRHSYLAYDDEGVFVRATQNQLGHISRALHHPGFGVPVLTEDANGAQQRMYYDGFGRVRKVEPEGASAVEIHHDAWAPVIAVRGSRVSAVSADGGAAYQITDEAGRLRESGNKTFDGEWAVAETDYNMRGRPSFTTRPHGEGAAGWGTSTSYDTLGRVVATYSSTDGASMTFQHAMFEDIVTDAKGRARRTIRDVDGRVSSSRDLADDGHEIFTRYSYGAFGLIQNIIDAAGHTTTIGYDKLGRRTSLVDPNRGTVQFEYSAHGELTREWDAAHDISYIHDEVGRVTRKEDTHGSPPVTEVTTFAYDSGLGAKGQISSAHSPDDVTTTFTYDDLGRPTATNVNIAGESFSFEQTYRPGDGRLDALWYPNAPGREQRFSVKHTYNDHGYLDTLTDDSVSPADPFWVVKERSVDGLLARAEWRGGAVEQRAYNSAGRPVNMRVDTPDPLLNTSYVYDHGELAQRTDHVTTRTETFLYDRLDRLKKWTLAGPVDRTVEYGYDDLGNLTSTTTSLGGQAQPGEVLGYETEGKPHAARWRWVGGQLASEYHYDARGRLREGGGRSVTWTGFDLPRTITQGGHTTTLTYDAFGARVKKVRAGGGDPTVTTVTLGGLYERRTESGTAEHRFFVQGDPGAVAEVVYDEAEGEDEVHAIAHDALGSVSLVFEPDGKVVGPRLFYEPFGRRVDAFGEAVAGPASGLSLGFTGHNHDDELDLINMKGRIYDPVLRRFLSPDPIVSNVLSGQSLNRYSYVWNNPLRYVDPTGYNVEGSAEPAPSSGVGAAIDDVSAFLYSFFYADELTVYKVKPRGQLLPEAASVEVQADDVQADDGAASTPKASPSSTRASRPVKEFGLDLGVARVVPILFILSVIYGGAESTLAHAEAAVGAAVDGDAYHAADHALQIPEDIGREAGAQIIDTVRAIGYIDEHFDQAMNGATTGDRIDGAVATGVDALTIVSSALALRSILRTGAIKCFASGTWVLMADGSTKKIEDVAVGDQVLAVEPNGDWVPQARPVTAVHATATYRIFHIRVAGAAGGEILATGGHPFWTPDGWVDAEYLTTDDQLVDALGRQLRIESIAVESRDVETYNLSVDDSHTFFVVAGEHSVLVHNVDPYDILFTQSSYGPTFSHGPWQGMTVKEAAQAARAAGRLPDGLVLNAVRMGADGRWATLNNRTLAVARIANLPDVHPVDAGDAGLKKFRELLRNSELAGPVEEAVMRCR